MQSLSARLPLTLTTGTVHNRVLRNASVGIAESVRAGGCLSGALRKAGVVPPLVVYLAARMAWFPVSATYSLSPAKTRPVGRLNLACPPELAST